RSYGDWSSDVCSSDLGHLDPIAEPHAPPPGTRRRAPRLRLALRGQHGQGADDGDTRVDDDDLLARRAVGVELLVATVEAVGDLEIGRASCRERGEGWG